MFGEEEVSQFQAIVPVISRGSIDYHESRAGGSISFYLGGSEPEWVHSYSAHYLLVAVVDLHCKPLM